MIDVAALYVHPGVSWCGNHTKSSDKRRRVGKAAAATPTAFRDVLIAMARTVR